LAEWPQRALGALIDWGIPMVVSMIGGVIGGLIGSIFSLAALAAMIYNTGYLAGTTGYSYGRKIAGTKLVSEKTLQPIGFGMAVGRYFVHCLDGAILMIGFLFPLFTPKKQTIADMLMGTLVLDEKKMQ
jgi:uncharacterized RDD family membrane protein YckC